jgi:FkbM family methyltransferase
MSLAKSIANALLRRRIKRCRRRGHPVPYPYAGKTRWINADNAAAYHLEHSNEKLSRLVDAIPVPPRVIFDIGGNCGLFSALARERFASAEIYCFEPAPDLAPLIRLNCGPSIRHLPYAIAGRDAAMKFYINEHSQQTNSLLRSAAEFYAYSQGVREIEVAARSVDSLCAELKISRVDVLKLDIQGSEFDALAGARATLPGVDVVFLESTWMEWESIVHVLPFAALHGFRYLSLIGEVRLGADLMLSRSPVRDPATVLRTFEIDRMKDSLPLRAEP